MKNHQWHWVPACAALVALSIIPVTSVQAQQSGARVLEEIIVTAAYREQGLQDVPVSISAVTGAILSESALQKAEDIQFLVPNFTLTETGIGTNAFIRGIGSGINQAFEQSVGTYIDGVYYGRAQQWRSPFLDLERVEVLRGPQAILFGKNSVAGAVNITTAKPTDEFEGSVLVSQEFENKETILEGMISGPFSDRFRGRLAVRSRELDGHMWNATLAKDEPNREDWTVRGIVEFDLSDNLLATFKAEVSEFDVTGRNIEIINDVAYHPTLIFFGGDPSTANVVKDGVRSSNGDFSNNESTTFALTLDWAIGEYDLESITAFSTFEYDEFCDCDFTGTEVFGAALQESYDQFSQEFRLSSPLGGSFDYILGLYYQTSEHDFTDQVIFSDTSVIVPIGNIESPGAGDLLSGTMADRVATVDADILSAFAQFNFVVSDSFVIQVGGRVTQDDRDGFRSLTIVKDDGSPLPAAQFGAPIVYGGLLGFSSTNLNSPLLGAQGAALVALLGELPVAGTRDTTKFSPEVKLIWDASDDSLVYFSWSEGFKSGSFDFRANNKAAHATMLDSFEFDDEEASNFELGGKFVFADGTFELNVAAYFTEFDNLQISIFDGGLGFNVGNAASAEVDGLEFDMRWAATDYTTISGGLSFTDFEFTDFQNGQCYFGRTADNIVNGVPFCDYTGESNQMVSDVQANVTFDYRRPVFGNLEFSGFFNLFFTDDYDASATYDPVMVQRNYSVINMRLALGSETGSWQVAALWKNMTDEKILSFGGDTPLSGSIFMVKSNYAFYGPGETISLQALFRF